MPRLVDAGQPLVDPDLLAGRGVERDQRVVPSQHVHHVVDDDGIEAGLRVRIEPRDLELADVGLLDLIEIDEIGSARPAAEVPPPLSGGMPAFWAPTRRTRAAVAMRGTTRRDALFISVACAQESRMAMEI